MRPVSRPRIGELLVSAGVLTQEKLDVALGKERPAGQRLGAYLVQHGLVSETQLTQILGQQLSVPWVSLYHIDFSRQLLNLVPREVADKYCLVPIYVRRVRKQGETLYVAMDDPTNEAALAEVSQHAGLPALPMIAAPSDIRSAIRVYYGTGETTGNPPAVVSSADLSPIARTRSSKPPLPAGASANPSPSAPPASHAPPLPPKPPLPVKPPVPTSSSTHAVPPPTARVEPAGDHPDAEPEIEAKEVEIPRRRARPMIAMTMLDGTTLHLPGGGGAKGDGDASGSGDAPMTARDLVRALRAVAHGKNPAELPHDLPKWEELFAALLSLLMRKGLVADWEFTEELKKVRRRKTVEGLESSTDVAGHSEPPKKPAG